METIKRGSTTQITFYVPDNVPLADIIALHVIFSWRTGVLLHKQMGDSDISIDEEGRTVTVELSEDDTLKLRKGVLELELDVKYNGGTVYRSYIERTEVEDTLLNREA